jgi:hypothetical protein
MLSEEQRFLEGLMQILRNKGYDCKLNGTEIDISKNGILMMSLRSNGDYKQHSGAVNECIYEIREIHQKTKEAYDNYNEAEDMQQQNVTNFRRLAMYNRIVLAARMRGDSSMEYVTWQQDHDNAGVSLGHYFTDYDKAKEDFAVRGGLVNRYKMLNETELKLIHQGLVHLGADYPHLTTEQMTNVGKLIEKVEIIVPAIQERSIYEAHELVAEDGLEI